MYPGPLYRHCIFFIIISHEFLPVGCRVKCVVYKATVTHKIQRVEYVGSKSNRFKVRYRNHKFSFTNENKMNETALSQYIWAKDLNKNEDKEKINPTISWEIIKNMLINKSFHFEIMRLFFKF